MSHTSHAVWFIHAGRAGITFFSRAADWESMSMYRLTRPRGLTTSRQSIAFADFNRPVSSPGE